MRENTHAFQRVGRFFARLTDRFYKAVANSPIGRIFTAYPAAEQSFRESGTVYLADLRRGKTAKRPLRRGMARAIDRSFLRRAVYLLINGICHCSLRTVGMFLLTSGAYSAIVTWLIASVWREGVPDAYMLFSGIGVALVGALLLFSEHSMAYVLEKGVISGWLLKGLMGLSDESLKDIPQKGKAQYAIAVPLGMAVGTLTAFTGPLYLLLALLAAVLVLAVLSVPESGIIVLLALAPFYGFVPHASLWLVLGAFLVLVGYCFKLLRGTRAFHMELQDLAVLLLLLFALSSAVSARGGGAAVGVITAVLLMALYFPVVNMFSTPHWLLRSRWALLLSATGASVLGIFQFVLAAVLAFGGHGEAAMAELGTAVCAGFSDHAVFAYFMVLAFPFALHAFIRSKRQYRLASGFACVAIAAAITLSWVQSAWIALAVEIVVITLLCKRYTLPYFVGGGAIGVGGWFLLPAVWRQRIGLTLRQTADISSVRTDVAGELAARLFFENEGGFFGRGAGMLRLLFGLGHDGLEAVCVLYTALPHEEVLSSFNFWLYRLAEGGIVGVILPAALFFLVLQNCFSLMRRATDVRSAVAPVSGVALICGVLTMSLFRYSWGDPAALLLFFMAIALVGADARNRRSFERAMVPIRQTRTHASVDYRVMHSSEPIAHGEEVKHEQQ